MIKTVSTSKLVVYNIGMKGCRGVKSKETRLTDWEGKMKLPGLKLARACNIFTNMGQFHFPFPAVSFADIVSYRDISR